MTSDENNGFDGGCCAMLVEGDCELAQLAHFSNM